LTLTGVLHSEPVRRPAAPSNVSGHSRSERKDLRCGRPGASITWAREIKNLNKQLLTPTVLDTVLKKINEQKITNSKDIRKLRKILKDPVAKNKFLSPESTIASAMETLASAPPKKKESRMSTRRGGKSELKQ
jgi:hypothetical protein